MTAFYDDPVKIVSKRVLLTSLVISVILIIGTVILNEEIVHVMLGFWVGVIISILSFRLMANNIKRMLDGVTEGVPAYGGNGYFKRVFLYGACLLGMAQVSFVAFIGSAIGLSMVGLILRATGYLSRRKKK